MTGLLRPYREPSLSCESEGRESASFFHSRHQGIDIKVGIIRCQQTEDLCPGTGDFAAVKKKSGAFETLGDCTIVGFVSCGGCPGSKAIARAQALMDRGAQAIALATCITKGNPDGFPCPNRDSILQALRKKCKEVPVLEYTH